MFLCTTVAAQYLIANFCICFSKAVKTVSPFLSWEQGWTTVLAKKRTTVMHKRIEVIWFLQRINVVDLHEVIAHTYG